MGRVSTKENKNIYQTTREALRLTREAAGELLETIPPERIEKIENERSCPTGRGADHGGQVQTAGLCNYYCANQCPIGQEYVPEVQIKDLSQIVLEMLASLNSMNRRKERLIEITADGVISDDELEDLSTSEKSWSVYQSRWRHCSCGRSGCWPLAPSVLSSMSL